MPATMQSSPATIAIPAANVAARTGSPAASGTIVAAMIGARDESGPNTRMRLGPTMA